MNDKIINLIMADDHPIFREGLKQIIEEEKNINVLGEADNGITALELILKHEPDVVLLDIDMPEKTGLDVMRDLNKNNRMKKKPKVVFLTVYSDEDIYDEGMELGISGYVLKDSAISEITECINKVYEGGYYISSSVSDFLFNKKPGRKKRHQEVSPLEKLTKSELKILKLIAEGITSREISEMLSISFKTTENHRTNISTKLNLKGYNSLVQFAMENKPLLK